MRQEGSEETMRSQRAEKWGCVLVVTRMVGIVTSLSPRGKKVTQCIRPLLLNNKWPQTYWLRQTTILSHNFRGWGVQAQLSCVLCSAAQGLKSRCRLGLLLDEVQGLLLSSLVVGRIRSLVVVRLRPQFPEAASHSLPHSLSTTWLFASLGQTGDLIPIFCCGILYNKVIKARTTLRSLHIQGQVVI